MEKIIYLIGDLRDGVSLETLHALAAGPVADAVESAGGRLATLHSADLNGWIQSNCPSRQIGDVDSIAALLSIWLPSSHMAEPVTEILQSVSGRVHAFLVTEAVWQEDKASLQSHQQRAGISFVSCISRNRALNYQSFFRHWDEHSVDSAALHPHRQSYTRHSVVRPLTQNAPILDGIVFEQFPSREVFSDDSVFFDLEVAQRTAEHTLQMIDLESLISNGFSEYRFAGPVQA